MQAASQPECILVSHALYCTELQLPYNKNRCIAIDDERIVELEYDQQQANADLLYGDMSMNKEDFNEQLCIASMLLRDGGILALRLNMYMALCGLSCYLHEDQLFCTKGSDTCVSDCLFHDMRLYPYGLCENIEFVLIMRKGETCRLKSCCLQNTTE